MHPRFLVLCMLLSALIVGATFGQTNQRTPLETLASNNTEFAFDLYQQLSTGMDNLIFSPYSISTAIAMLHAGARGETQAQIEAALRFTLEPEELHASFAQLQDVLTSSLKERYEVWQQFELNLANAIWGQVGYPFTPDYLDLLSTYYNSGLQSIDFAGDVEAARQTINAWVAQKTNDRIIDLIPPGALSSIARMVLTNAIYFNATWVHLFDKESTQPDLFTTLDGRQVPVQMMSTSQAMSYAAGPGYQMIGLPYRPYSESLNFYAIVPDAGQFEAVEAALDAAWFVDAVEQADYLNVNLGLPRFTIETATDLAETLTAMGMGDAFTIDADFSGIADPSTVDEPLFLDSVIHKAFISVDEEGTEAAAATALGLGGGGPPNEPIDVTLDRPFIYVIYHERTQSVLFMGRVVAPEPDPSAAAASLNSQNPSDEDLSPVGPWLVFYSGEGIWKNGLWAANADGTGLRLLSGELMVRSIAPQYYPPGGSVAYISARDDALHRLTLKRVSLPNGTVSIITPLTSPATEPADNSPGVMHSGEYLAQTRPAEHLLAIAQEPNAVLSPDGTMIAFMGALDGPSSDLYVYSLQTNAVTRLTDGPSQGIRPTWSPDSRYIVHFGVDAVGTGEGAQLNGVWAAAADGSQLRSLFEPVAFGDERVIGWLDNTNCVVETHVSWITGPELGRNAQLRAVNVETGQIHDLWTQSFASAAVNPIADRLLVAVDNTAVSHNSEPLATGLYLVDPDGTAMRVIEDSASYVRWSADGPTDSGLFFAITEFGTLVVAANGAVRDISQPTRRFPIVQPGGNLLAWYGVEGLWVGPLNGGIDNPPRQMHDAPVTQALWDPSGGHIHFFSEGNYYVAYWPEYEPVLIREEIHGGGAYWVIGQVAQEERGAG